AMTNRVRSRLISGSPQPAGRPRAYLCESEALPLALERCGVDVEDPRGCLERGRTHDDLGDVFTLDLPERHIAAQHWAVVSHAVHIMTCRIGRASGQPQV